MYFHHSRPVKVTAVEYNQYLLLFNTYDYRSSVTISQIMTNIIDSDHIPTLFFNTLAHMYMKTSTGEHGGSPLHF